MKITYFHIIVMQIINKNVKTLMRGNVCNQKKKKKNIKNIWKLKEKKKHDNR